MLVLNLFYRSFVLIVLGLAAQMAYAESGASELRAAVNLAWQRSPQARTLEARRDEVLASGDAAHALTAGAPAIGLAQRSDRWSDQNGRRETEVSLSAPVWLPGQKSARQTLVQASADDLEAQIANTRLALAGEVRERLWAVAAAREALSEAQDHIGRLEALADEVMRRVKAGDLARTDGMLAQQELLASRAALGLAQARVNEALSRYRTLTGQPDTPPPVVEPIGSTPADPHPRMIAARTALQHAQASLNVVNVSRSDPPTAGVAMRREQDSNVASANRTIRLSIQIPIGTRARNRPLETAAYTQIETATAEARQAESALQTDIDLARQQLAVTQEALDMASSRTVLALDHFQLIEKAFRLGERGLADVLRAQSLVHEADAAERQQRVAVGLAHARLNQALGILP
ncbi:MAG: TolC family protein [Burkholderiaceae bacterium]|jgi:cobalt-zinc-cadmium efflux system outer membrane protein